MDVRSRADSLVQSRYREPVARSRTSPSPNAPLRARARKCPLQQDLLAVRCNAPRSIEAQLERALVATSAPAPVPACRATGAAVEERLQSRAAERSPSRH